ncbi:MAG TPA: GNAT family N-acetyltransferase [Clostridiales bacterium]|nr:GNAT family N-acetyltransferase [Clostridiales bacterium]
MVIKIRKAEFSDHSQIRDLVKEVHELHFSNRPDVYEDIEDPFTEERFKSLLEDIKTDAFVAVDNENIAAYAFVRFIAPVKIDLLKQYLICYIDDFCVKKSYQRKGVGIKLFAHIKKRAVEKGASTLDLTVWEFNTNAIKFYESLGMTTKNRRMEIKL